MANFTGKLGTSYVPPRVDAIAYAVSGFQFNHATEAGTLGLREAATFRVEQVGYEDAAKRFMYDKILCSLEANLFQARIADIKNLYLLSRSPHQLRFAMAGGQYFNFVDNTNFTTAAGSSLVGLEFEFEVTDSMRSLKANWQTAMAQVEYDWMLANATAHAGTTGGTSLGLTAGAYNRANFAMSTIDTDSVTINGYAPGYMTDAKLSIKFTGPKKTTRQQPICCFAEVSFTASMLQSKVADLQAVITASKNDYTILVPTWNGDTFKFTTGALGFKGVTELGDKDTVTQIEMTGSIPFDPIGTTSNIDLGVTSATIAEFKLDGY
ncbi:MAG: hypothetical protein JNJ94_06320 [Chlorobi bacterium]|nr:hypothetical protein [Chlorobiota bacterium]